MYGESIGDWGPLNSTRANVRILIVSFPLSSVSALLLLHFLLFPSFIFFNHSRFDVVLSHSSFSFVSLSPFFTFFFFPYSHVANLTTTLFSWLRKETTLVAFSG
ncbi:hypothetical protein VNO77_05767 [Canavalia gladiata]|uniref:Transmembrane protein n=1 Tax=Canavalia gladiata TaxID=3824 RepID=A0AAN9REG2_CANGL